MLLNFCTIPDYFNLAEIENLNVTLNEFKVEGKDNPAVGVSKTCIVDTVLWRDIKETLIDLEQNLHFNNTSLFGFNILPFTNYDNVNLNTYTSDFESEYSWHNDFILSERIYDNKLTVIVNISTEAYTGGEFQLFLTDEMTIADKPGTVIIFPSWTQHRVKPVISGVRKSLSFWIKGPKLT